MLENSLDALVTQNGVVKAGASFLGGHPASQPATAASHTCSLPCHPSIGCCLPVEQATVGSWEDVTMVTLGRREKDSPPRCQTISTSFSSFYDFPKVPRRLSPPPASSSPAGWVGGAEASPVCAGAVSSLTMSPCRERERTVWE